MKKIGVILSGCGVYDGSEIHEAVLTLLAISRSGAQAVCFAPDKQQVDVINHLTGEAMTETRNVLIEAARITRGEIRPLTQADAAELDALIVPGGFGAAKNLSNFASLGSECTVDRELKALAQAMHQAGKPLGFMCIAPSDAAENFRFPAAFDHRLLILIPQKCWKRWARSMCRVLSMISWLMKTIRLSPPRHICWRRTLQKRRVALISWFPACWSWRNE